MTPWTDCDKPGSDLLTSRWITPPAAQGQIVVRSYSLGKDGHIYRSLYDRSDMTYQYQRRPLGDDETFEPWDLEPQ